MKRFFICCLVIAVVIGIAGCGFKEANKSQRAPVYPQDMSKKELDALAEKAGETASQEAKKAAEAGAPWAKSAPIDASGPRVVIETNQGRIVFVMFPKKAPKTVENFIKLANKGFYNGLKWHGVVPGKIILGGDPLSRDANSKDIGTGGPGYTIKAEFNDIHNIRGTVGMGRTKDINSAGSQFYICLSPQPNLYGKFTVFGQVVEGMDVADKIKVNDTMAKVYIEGE